MRLTRRTATTGVWNMAMLFRIFPSSSEMSVTPNRIYRRIQWGRLEQFRNYCGLKKIARCGFPWEKTTEGPVASVYTNCKTALVIRGLERKRT